MILSPVQAKSVTRFRAAQDRAWPRIARELAVGRKQSHWMWFVFPQLKALAKSETARYFGLADQAEALAYLDDQVLRVRLFESSRALLGHRRLMFTDTDKRKLHACMTLFSEVAPEDKLPEMVLSKWYGGQKHQLTLDVLAGRPIPTQWTAQGRVETRRWHQGALAARPEWSGIRTTRGAGDPMERSDVETFVRKFGLSTANARLLVDEWLADRQRAANAAWDEADEAYNR